MVTPPNRDFYRNYDDRLRDSSKREPLEFFNEVLQQDLPVTDFLDSDFLVIDERLARHYGIEGVEGDKFRRVPLRPTVGAAACSAWPGSSRTLPTGRARFRCAEPHGCWMRCGISRCPLRRRMPATCQPSRKET